MRLTCEAPCHPLKRVVKDNNRPGGLKTLKSKRERTKSTCILVQHQHDKVPDLSPANAIVRQCSIQGFSQDEDETQHIAHGNLPLRVYER